MRVKICVTDQPELAQISPDADKSERRGSGLWTPARDERLVSHETDKDGLGRTGRVGLGIRGGKIGGHYGVLHEGEPIRGGLDYGAEGLEYGAEGLDRKAD